jgi:hypothetical protein
MEKLQDADPRQAGGYGPTLAAVVTAHGPLPVNSVLTLAAGLAQALSAAHAACVVHHDLSPASVLLTADGPRLTGFGAPRTDGHGQAARAVPLNFPPPERAAVAQADPASDIFNLGAVLLYAATGNLMSHFAWHLDQLPGELRPVIERCMAADPARRPTAAGLVTELTAARPHAAWPPSRIPAAGPAPSGSLPAQGWTPAPPFPAETITIGARKKASRPAALIRRHAWLIAVGVLAFVVALAGTVYVIHPGRTPCCARPGSRPTSEVPTRSPSAGRIPRPGRSPTST